MKRALLVGVPFLVTLAAALWFFGVFDRPRPGGLDRPATERTASGDVVPADLALVEPKDEPAPEVPPFASPVRVLAIGQALRSFTSWAFGVWSTARLVDGRTPAIEWQVWLTEPSHGADTHSEGLPALERQPTSADLEGVHVLVLAAADPSKLPAEFWSAAAQRVRDGRLGLLVIPEHQHGKAIADEPSLSSVVPVDLKPLAPERPGENVIPGVFTTPKPLAVTPDGIRHPATRIVAFPGWSERIWARMTRGPEAWVTKFTSPVEKVDPGAKVLVEVDTGTSKIPTVVASSGERGRVLWAGAFLDLDWVAYRTVSGGDQRAAMAISWIAWLAPSGA
jgi:hypothetical protein